MTRADHRTRAVVDTHVHVWRRDDPWMAYLEDRPAAWEPVRRDVTWEQLRGELDRAGVGELVLVQAGTSVPETQLLLDLAARQPSVVGVVGWVGLASPAVTERDLSSVDRPDTKLVGVRCLNGWAPDGDVLTSPHGVRAATVLADRGLALDLLLPDHEGMAPALPFVAAIPHGRFVIDHLGRPPIDGGPEAHRRWAELMTELSAHPGVYVKYSGWATTVGRTVADDVRPFIDHVLQVFGTRRVMYASNWPVALIGADYAQTWAATLDALPALDEPGLDDVFHGAARACYRLSGVG